MIRDFIHRTVAPHFDAERDSRLRTENQLYRTIDSMRREFTADIDQLMVDVARLREQVRVNGGRRTKTGRKVSK